MGGGVGGINYAEYSDGSELNYKFYNLRGDVIMTLDTGNNVKSRSIYTAFGTHTDVGTIATDSHRANTKVEDSDGLLNEGKRFRSLDYAVFLTPDPLEYVDGLNQYIYVGQNPWGSFDPLGLYSWKQFKDDVEYVNKSSGEMVNGYGMAIQDRVIGISDMVLHPIDTVQGIANAASHPVETYNAINDGIIETWNSGYEGKGRVLAHAAIGAVTLGAGNLSKAGSLSKAGQTAAALERGSETVAVVNSARILKNVAETAGEAAKKPAPPPMLKAASAVDDINAVNNTSVASNFSLSDVMGTRIPGGRTIDNTLPLKSQVRNVNGFIFKRVENAEHGGIKPHTHPYFRNTLPDGTIR
jgi:RHS repeat-associated protein